MTISIEAYAREVQNMRQTQKNYFETKNTAVLADAKRRERIVDRMTREILEGTQGELFDLGGEGS